MKKINTSILSVLTITTLASFSHAATTNGSCNCVPNTNNNLQESAVLIVETPIVEPKKVHVKPRKRHPVRHYQKRKTPTPLVNAYCQDQHLPEFIW